MHSYSCDTKEHGNATLILLMAAASLGSAYALSIFLKQISIDLWFIEWPSVLGFYGIYYSLVDRKLWKVWPIRLMLNTTDISGNYIGSAWSSHNGDNPTSINARIAQTMTHISVVVDTETSRSHSESASLCEREPGKWQLTYTYLNKPKNNAVQTMNIHEGTAKLIFSKSSPTIEGEYYNGRNRGTVGVLKLEKDVPIKKTNSPKTS